MYCSREKPHTTYYTILSNKYVVNDDDDDTHWTGWITQTCQHISKGSVVEKKRNLLCELLRDVEMRNWDLIGWAGMHEFIIEQFFSSPSTSNDADNYEGLWFNEKKKRKRKSCPHACLFVIGFRQITVGGAWECALWICDPCERNLICPFVWIL